jgi:hypothetical protein
MEVFMEQIVRYQEDTFLGMIAHKDIMRWYEKSHKDLTHIEYTIEI